MSARWEGVNEQAARRLAAWTIRRARKDEKHGFTHPLEELRGVGFMVLMDDDVALAREYARAAVLVQESRDRGYARLVREWKIRRGEAL
jgi:proline racemase